MGKDYYSVLGVKREADENELKKGTASASIFAVIFKKEQPFVVD